MFEVDYYESEDGKRPAEQFINALDKKMKAKTFRRLGLLEEYGSMLTAPFSAHLGEGIFELRVSQGNNAIRVLYFFVSGQRAILTHGFVKKTRKTPRSELKRAKRLRNDWRQRNG